MEDFFLGNGHLLFFVYDAVRLLGYSCCPALLYTMLFHSDSPSSGTAAFLPSERTCQTTPLRQDDAWAEDLAHAESFC